MKRNFHFAFALALLLIIVFGSCHRHSVPTKFRKARYYKSARTMGGPSIQKSRADHVNSDIISDIHDAHITEDVSPGKLTATEINDFARWELWKDISESDLNEHQSRWHIKPLQRYSVLIKSTENRPVPDATVRLLDASGKAIWTAKSDNRGRAELWLNLFEESYEPGSIEVSYKGSSSSSETLSSFGEGVNVFTLDAKCEVPNQLDLLFMVDATGSMGDEINHLKTELTDIIEQVSEKNSELTINLGSLFYRCKGNEYTTRQSQFSTDISKTVNFIKKQTADEGGIEAVEIALDEAVNDFAWNEKANARLLIMVLDESPGINTYQKLASSIKKAAEKGIRIIPVVSSGVSHLENKSLEYLMRSFALATNGTNAFLTDHSGVGNAHTAPSTDVYDVELLNNLLIRVINQYAFIPACDEDYEKEMAELEDSTVVEIIDRVVVDRRHIEPIEPDTIEFQFENSDSLGGRDSADIEDEEKEILDLTPDNPDTTQVDEQVKRFSFYPNPTSGSVTVETNIKGTYVYLFDGNGKLLERFSVRVKSNTTIDVSMYANGIYYLGYLKKERWYKSKLLLVH